MERTPRRTGDARARLLDAALVQIRTRGYEATSIDDLCRAAGVTKGAFFHHFRSKEELGIAAAARFLEWLEALFVRSGWRDHADPLQRVLAYVDFRTAILRGEIPHFTCLIGMMVQETFSTHPALQAACEAGIRSHLAPLEAEIEAAFASHGIEGVSAAGLALHIMAVIQGGFVLAKAAGGPAPAIECMHHLRRYIECLFAVPGQREGTGP
ncbi:TetR/AcrR family transcriptional regulator [Roseomonas sp. JC162]|uniref:TetR/AcrR family transcriptional regulator n=1 Tax=Neoroseomonas marina TaxID=1232220 RepID=A0A848EJC5_9PROT|nr:TetR/AcrR family transcriptional regulator [Neoroseomonas marina]NMJ43488.1 TetR/AcrR family transcriptional regulator [Neoroseomonas marina]